MDQLELEAYARALGLRINAVEMVLNDVVSALVSTHPDRKEILKGLDQYLEQDRDTASGDTLASVTETFLQSVSARD